MSTTHPHPSRSAPSAPHACGLGASHGASHGDSHRGGAKYGPATRLDYEKFNHCHGFTRAVYSDAELGKLLPRMTFAWMKAHEAAFAPTSVAWVDKADGFSFVRRGKVGGGKEDLTAAQREAIERACWCADDCYSAVIGKEHTLAGLSP